MNKAVQTAFAAAFVLTVASATHAAEEDRNRSAHKAFRRNDPIAFYVTEFTGVDTAP